MKERIANNAFTNLAETINESQTTISVIGLEGFPQPHFRIVVDDEIMLVESIDDTSLSVHRGCEGTTPTLHHSGSRVGHVITAHSLANMARGDITFGVDTGSENEYVVTLDPSPESYFTGMIVRFQPLESNTGESTLSLGSLPAKTIFKNFDEPLLPGDMIANKIYTVMFDGDDFQLLHNPRRRLNRLIPDNEIDGETTMFTMPGGFVPGSCQIYLNGLRLAPTHDFTEDEDCVEFVDAPVTGDRILVDYEV